MVDIQAEGEGMSMFATQDEGSSGLFGILETNPERNILSSFEFTL